MKGIIAYFVISSDGKSHRTQSVLKRDEPFLISFPPWDSSPFSSSSFSCNLPCWSPAVHAQVPAKLAEEAPVESQVLFGGRIPGDEVFPCTPFVLHCSSWKSIRFLVSRWSISSLKQPRAASARLATCGVASVVAISAMRWEKGLWVTGSIPMPESFLFSLVFQ
ncbi:hypothetical protein NC651_027714 [Populus alba x Populus x berolinensis]|nr:hypothetical protein NC651_027714 [Populus alba x Populus x berolinensis]